MTVETETEEGLPETEYGTENQGESMGEPSEQPSEERGEPAEQQSEEPGDSRGEESSTETVKYIDFELLDHNTDYINENTDVEIVYEGFTATVMGTDWNPD